LMLPIRRKRVRSVDIASVPIDNLKPLSSVGSAVAV
jgi:hypothetical protein